MLEKGDCISKSHERRKPLGRAVLSSLTGLTTLLAIITSTKVPAYYLAVPLGPHYAH
jgi:hypothetical protein